KNPCGTECRAWRRRGETVGMEPDGANILRDTGLISARQIPVTLMKYQPAEDVQTLFHRVNLRY
ncbi:hypothetical protein EVG73_29105, partial [Salmonella enterica subsp. enterica serovar Newport]|nr:hypothetical protein [Salmonella enterica subsp. enterica serovar Newport]